MIRIIKDRQLIEDVHNYDVILYGMGINNSMNNGFAYDIALNFPIVKETEDATGYGDIRKYGEINEVETESLLFCACYSYNVGLKRKNNGEFIDYAALENCLHKIHNKYKGKHIASPIIGQDKYDGNGDKDKLTKLYEQVFSDCDITLYDFIQQDFRTERYKEAVELRKKYKNREITRDEFTYGKKLNEWKRLHGIFKKMPDGFVYNEKCKSKNKISIKK